MAVEQTEQPEQGEDLVEAGDGRARDLLPRTSEDKRPADGIVPGLHLNDAVGQTLLATIVAWSTTVAPAVFSRSAPRTALVAAVLGLLAGLGGPLLRSRRPRLARHIGLTLFFVLVMAAWLLASSALEPLRLDALRASVGAIAWGAFALSWREPWEVDDVDPGRPDPNASLLQPRSALPRGAAMIVAVGVASSLVFLVLAWNVRDGDRALVAHALAVACAVAITSVAASTAVDRGRRSSSRSARRVTSSAGRALLLLFTFVAAGVAVLLLRR